MASYNGHRSKNAWNVSLWINNDEGLYQRALGLARVHGIGKGSELLARELDGMHTPDGVPFTKTSVREAMRGMR